MRIDFYLRSSKFVNMILIRMREHDVSGMAAQLAFFFLLSLFPLLIFLIALIPYLPFTAADIMALLATIVPEDSLAFIEPQLEGIMERNRGLLSVSILGTLWTASNAMNGLLKSFDKAYDVVENRKYIIRRAIALLMTVGLIFLLIIVLMLPVFGKQIGVFLYNLIGFSEHYLVIWNFVRWISSIIGLYLIFTLLYWVLPYIKWKRKSVFWGALFATIGWSVVSYGFSFYVNHFSNYSNTYGSIGGIIVLMLWLYLSAHIIVLGGEINAIITNRRSNKHHA